MLLGPTSSDEKAELRKAPIPSKLLTVIGWARGFRLLVKVALPPVVLCVIAAKFLIGADLDLEGPKAVLEWLT
jgi:hypothetical protein